MPGVERATENTRPGRLPGAGRWVLSAPSLGPHPAPGRTPALLPPPRAEGGRLPAKLRRWLWWLFHVTVSALRSRVSKASACLNGSWVLCLSNSHTLTHSLPAPSRQVEISTELSVARGGRGMGGGGVGFGAKASWSLLETEHRLSGCQSWAVWSDPLKPAPPGGEPPRPRLLLGKAAPFPPAAHTQKATAP